MSGADADFASKSVEDSRFDQPAVQEAQELIESQGLRFEPEFDDLVGIYENAKLIACGARAGYVLKMITIAPSHQGTDALGRLVTNLVMSAFSAGHSTVFVFTPPQNVATFEALNFHMLAMHSRAALLEYGPGLDEYLASHASEVFPGDNGAVVVNANPFTLGHLHLVEYAAGKVNHLYLFVVREDASEFPFDVRFRLAKEAMAHIGNVIVLDTSRYAVSSGTFPSYFLKRLDDAARIQMRLDVLLFAERIAPPFHIACRFVGQEPQSQVTAAYNKVMAAVLKAHSIRWVELPRLAANGFPISAKRVRELFAKGDFENIRGLVPAPTLAYLQSPEAGAIAARLRSKMEVL